MPRGGTTPHVFQECEDSWVSFITNLIFNHFHTDHQAFSTDITNDLILVSEFGQLCQKVVAHFETGLLRAILCDSLS